MLESAWQYLVTRIDILPSAKSSAMPDEPQYSRVCITVSNTAPGLSDRKTVFTNIALLAAKTNSDSKNLTAEELNLKINRTKLPATENDKERLPQNLSFTRLNGTHPVETDEKSHNGETLHPGESLSFEMDLSNPDLPYFQFCLEGSVSLRHLCRNEIGLPIAEEYTRPIIRKALLDFNAIEIHRFLKEILLSTPQFNNDTKLSKIRNYFGVLGIEEGNIDAAQKSIDEVYRKYKLPVFQNHVQQIYDHLAHIKTSLTRLHQAISSSIAEDISEEIGKLEKMNGEAKRINSETELIMANFGLSDDEVKYKYRAWVS